MAFLPVMHDLLTGQTSSIRCGAGQDTFAIHVDGAIGICPISPDWSLSLVGNIWTTKPAELKNVMSVEEPCLSCEDYGLCGGRCLFANRNRLWDDEGFTKGCDTVKHLLACLRERVPEIQELINQTIITLDDFAYPGFNNGCEIIP